MPDCPKCGVTCGLHEKGLICPVCLGMYTYIQDEHFPKYDYDELIQYRQLFDELYYLGLLHRGKNRVEFFEDGVIISTLDDIY